MIISKKTTSRQMLDLSLILPVQNEAAGIEEFIETVCRAFEKKGFSYEIIGVENGSTDNSYQVLKNLKKKYRQLQLLQSEKGWGRAVCKGIQKANGKYLCYMVSDGQIDPWCVPILLTKIQEEKWTMVKIKRIKRENAARLLLSRILSLSAKSLLGINSADINGTPKLIKTELIKKLNLRSVNIALDMELLLKLKKHNFTWIELPVISKKRGYGQSTTNISAILETTLSILKFRFAKID